MPRRLLALSRLLSPLLFVFIVLPQGAETFPVPVLERSVSDIVWNAAAGAQVAPRLATNGDVTLAVWRDERGGGYGARLAADGKSLDPTGIRIADGAPDAIVWNGSAFVVLSGRKLIVVSTDLSVLETRSFILPHPDDYQFAAATDGPQVRFLFIPLPSAGRAAIVDGQGNVTVTLLSKPGWGVGGSDGSGFLVLHEFTDESTGRRIVADRLDGDGRLVSSSDSGLPFNTPLFDEKIARGGDGFVVLRRAPGEAVIAYLLDSAGKYRGQSTTLASGAGYLYWKASVVFDDGRYLATWEFYKSDGPSEWWVAEIYGDGSARARRSDQSAQGPRGVTILSRFGRRFVAASVYHPGSSYDVYAAPLSLSLVAGDWQLLAVSGTAQFYAAIAAGVNGFAITWGEIGADDMVHLYVRRFSSSGVAQDPAPLEALTLPRGLAYDFGTDPNVQTKIVSTSEAYIIAAGSVFRRLSARRGKWLDREPVSLPMHDLFTVDFASNGSNVLAASIVACGGSSTYPNSCLITTLIPMNGDPPAAPVVTPLAEWSEGLAIGSNGSDYLVVWPDKPGRFCICYVPNQLNALRLRSDGTPLDRPSLLFPPGNYGLPRIGLIGGRYFIAWSDLDGIRGTRISTQGTVLDRNAQGGGVLLGRGNSSLNDAMRAAPTPFDGRFALLLLHHQLGEVLWEGVAFAVDADLGSILPLPRTALLTRSERAYPSFAAAASDGLLAIAYDRAASEAGNAPRVYLSLLRPPARRRVVGH